MFEFEPLLSAEGFAELVTGPGWASVHDKVAKHGALTLATAEDGEDLDAALAEIGKRAAGGDTVACPSWFRRGAEQILARMLDEADFALVARSPSRVVGILSLPSVHEGHHLGETS